MNILPRRGLKIACKCSQVRVVSFNDDSQNVIVKQNTASQNHERIPYII